MIYMDYKFKLSSFESEKLIEDSILEFLSFKGTVFKMNMGGKPLVLPNGHTIMVPFKNIYSPIGISDILFLCKGKSYFFEVKKPSEKKHIEKFYSYYSSIDPKRLLNKNKKTIAQQVQFINRMRKEEFTAGFVCSIEEVENFLAGR